MVNMSILVIGPVETELYYCNSRYYSPELCRWISPDDISYLDPESVNGLNLYCYCYNNPISYYDPSGHSAILVGLIIGAIVGACIGFGTAAYIDYQDDGQIFNGSVAWYDYLGTTVLGGAIGAGIGYIAPYIGSAFSSFAAQKFTIGGGAYLAANGELVVSAGLTFTGAQVLQGASLLAEVTVMTAILGKSGGYTVKQYPNNHDPAHVHIFGDDIADKAHGIRIGIDGNPLPGQGKLPPGAKKALKKIMGENFKSFTKIEVTRMNNIFEKLLQYGFHDTDITAIEIESFEIILEFKNGIYLLDENGRERNLSKPLKIIFKINSTFVNTPRAVFEIREYVKKLKYLDYSTFEKYFQKDKFGILMLYYSNFNNSILIEGGICNKQIMFSIEDIDEVIIHELNY